MNSLVANERANLSLCFAQWGLQYLHFELGWHRPVMYGSKLDGDGYTMAGAMWWPLQIALVEEKAHSGTGSSSDFRRRRRRSHPEVASRHHFSWTTLVSLSNFFELYGQLGQRCEQPIGVTKLSPASRNSWPMWAAKCHLVGLTAIVSDSVVDLREWGDGERKEENVSAWFSVPMALGTENRNMRYGWSAI